jgi:hypothetical protein
LTYELKRYILRYNVGEKEKTLCIKTDLQSLASAQFTLPTVVRDAGRTGIIMGACAMEEESGDFPAVPKDAASAMVGSGSSMRATSSW